MTHTATTSRRRAWLTALGLAVVASWMLGNATQASALGQITYGGCVSGSGSGGLCGVGNASAMDGSSSVVTSPDGRSLYTVAKDGTAITVYDRAPAGQITYAGCVSNNGSGGTCADAPGTPLSVPNSAAVSPDGR